MAQYQRKLKKGIRWWYKFGCGGKKYFSKAMYLTKAEAKRGEYLKYEQVMNEERNPSQKPALSLLEAINERLDYIKTKKSLDYYLDNKRYYTILINHTGDINLKEVSKATINSILLKMSERLQKQGKDNYAVNAALRAYKALFSFVIRNHDLNLKNPCLGIEFYSVKKDIKYIPTDKEIEEALSKCDTEEKLLIEFIEETGARISEALRVTGKDINHGYVVLYTRKSRNSDLTPRTVPCSLKLPAVGQNERLFARWSNRPQFLEEIVKEFSHPDWNFHNLRHRKASIWANIEKRPLYEVMSLLGHNNLSTTQGYLQLIPKWVVSG